jgi:hypothetical protein
MNQFISKKFTSSISFLLLGLILLSGPLNQAVLCMESDGHSNIEYSVVGSCEKSLCAQPNQASNAHVDDCENCTDISLSQNLIARKGHFQSLTPDSSLLQIMWVLDTLSFDFPEYIAQHWSDPNTNGQTHNSPLAHRQTIVLLI